MATGTYLIRVRMTGFEKSCDRELQEVLGRIMEGAGSIQLESILREVSGGEPAVVYQTNSAKDAEVVVGMLKNAGATVEVAR